MKTFIELKEGDKIYTFRDHSIISYKIRFAESTNRFLRFYLDFCFFEIDLQFLDCSQEGCVFACVESIIEYIKTNGKNI